MRRLVPWLTGPVRRWYGLVTAGAALAGVGVYVATARREWAWLAIGALVLLVVSLAWSLHDEYYRRVRSEEETGRSLELRNRLGLLARQADAMSHLCLAPPAPGQSQQALDQELLHAYLDWSNRTKALLAEASGDAAVAQFEASREAAAWSSTQAEMLADRYQDGVRRVEKLIKQLDKGQLPTRDDWRPVRTVAPDEVKGT